MKGFRFLRTSRAVLAAVLLLGVGVRFAPPAPALAYGAGDTPTPPPTPAADGSRTYDFPAEAPLVTVTMPPKWSAAYERGTGRLLCVPSDGKVGYTAVLSQGGDFATFEQAQAFLVAQVKETVAEARLNNIKLHRVENGKLGSGLPCQVQVVDGKIGNVPTRFVFICLAPVPGKYFLLTARGRQDRLAAAGFGAVGPLAASIKAR